jgi:hypothetical protein
MLQFHPTLLQQLNPDRMKKKASGRLPEVEEPKNYPEGIRCTPAPLQGKSAMHVF